MRGRRDQRERKKAQHRINDEIRAREVRLVDEEGGMLGVQPIQEALRMAMEKGLDLIEVAPDAKPPTCKVMDYGKYKYETKKRAQESKKKQTIISIKEIQLRPRTDQHDMDVKLKHARRFLEGGDKTKVNLRFRGREMAHQELGREVLEKVIEALKDISVVEVPPKREGRQLFVLLAPDPARLREIQKAKLESVENKKSDAKEAPAKKTKPKAEAKPKAKPEAEAE